MTQGGRYLYSLTTLYGSEHSLWKELPIPEQNLVAQRGARTHDPEIKSLMLYRLS